MTDTKWGERIAINGRPEWLREGDKLNWLPNYDGEASCWPDWCDADWREVTKEGIRLPADHPYYLATSRGFEYWPGGDEAPADWDGGEVLFRDGEVNGESFNSIWKDWKHEASGLDVIGYRRRVEPAAPDDTVTITRLTEAQWAAIRPGIHGCCGITALRELGLVRDPTPAERIAAETGVALADVEKVLAAQ